MRTSIPQNTHQLSKFRSNIFIDTTINKIILNLEYLVLFVLCIFKYVIFNLVPFLLLDIFFCQFIFYKHIYFWCLFHLFLKFQYPLKEICKVLVIQKICKFFFSLFFKGVSGSCYELADCENH